MRDRERQAQLLDFAAELKAAGFRVWVPNDERDSPRYLQFSQIVDGKECFGTVQVEQTPLLTGFTYSMPIKPSTQDGSSMFVDGVDDNVALDVAFASQVAQPRNHNPLVGTKDNSADARWAHMYTEV